MDDATGSMATLAQWYDLHAPALYRAALTMTGSPQDAQDMVQDVFTAAASSPRQLSAVRDTRAYLFTALHHAIARLAQRRRREHVTLADRPAPQPRAATDGPDDRLSRALAKLPAEQRQVIALKIDAGLTFVQVAGVLGIGINTAGSRYRYALEKLRAQLEQEP